MNSRSYMEFSAIIAGTASLGWASKMSRSKTPAVRNLDTLKYS
jgi:hypothetical protein